MVCHVSVTGWLGIRAMVSDALSSPGARRCGCESGHAPAGGIWAHGCKCLPIRDRRHYHNTRGYIHDHVKKGAVIWERIAAPGMESFDPDSLLIL